MGGPLLHTVLRSRFVARTASAVLRPLVHRVPLRDGQSRALSLAVRAPIPDAWFLLRLPTGQNVTLPSAWAHHLYWGGLGAFEPDLVPAFLARVQRARRFVDVGANFGFYALVGALVNPSLDVRAVEPNPEVAAVLREGAARNGVALEIYELALSDRAGTAQLSMRGGLSSVVSSRWLEGERLHLVGTARFDDVFPAGADLVKVDVEGAEADVLAGMVETVRRDRPAILCEVGPESVGAVMAFADEHSYELLALPGERPVDRLEVDQGSVNVVLQPVGVS